MNKEMKKEEILKAMELVEGIAFGKIRREQYVEDNRDNWKEIGAEYKFTRESFNISKAEMARLIGCSPSKVNKFENGEPIQASTMMKRAYTNIFNLKRAEQRVSGKLEKTIWNPEQWTDKQRVETINLLWGWICTNDHIYDLWKYLRKVQEGFDDASEYDQYAKEFQRMLHNEMGKRQVEWFEGFYTKEKKEIEEYKLRKLAMKSPIAEGIH